jgi:hypothetical protein
MSKEETIPAVERSVTVNASAEKAFSVFTEQVRELVARGLQHQSQRLRRGLHRAPGGWALV